MRCSACSEYGAGSHARDPRRSARQLRLDCIMTPRTAAPHTDDQTAQDEPAGPGFAALGLARSSSPCSPSSATKSRRRSSARRSRRCSPGRDVLGQAATGTGKTAAFALPLLQRIAAPEAAERAHRAAGSSWCRRASWRCRSPRRCTATGAALGIRVLPDLRRRRRCGSSCARSSAASTSSSPRRAARSTTSAAGRSTLDGVRTVVLDEADEMLDMGFAEDLEAILDGDARGAADGALLGDDAAAHHRRSPSATCANPVRVTIAREKTRRRASCRGSARRRTSCARAHKVAALGRVLDMESPTSAHRVLPHAHRGRRADRDAQRARLRRRGAARRHVAGAARPRDDAASATAHGRPARRDRRRRARAGHRARSRTS